eukprot:TRINITY_DN13495_c0_g1_i1.p1 TRINITY_DN13495_c0_g1~~TRINITY_DN13495_c0_g1_i1.p1  ORF type:complete len:317 (+),score=40.37 TRINITY_DN13495_c0_g1_i1:46-951(+)
MSSDHIPLVDFASSQRDIDRLEQSTPVARIDRSSHVPALVVGVVCFLIGISLLIPGIVLLTGDPTPDIPYVWTLHLCPVGDISSGIFCGVNITDYSLCPPDLNLQNCVGSQTGSQEITVPSEFLDNRTPYRPYLDLTDKATGFVGIEVHEGLLTKFADDTPFSGLTAKKFVVPGGEKLQIYREGPLRPANGDYVTTNCADAATGCDYEPGRSLNRYDFDNEPMVTGGPRGHVKIVVDQLVLYTNSNATFYPDAFVGLKQTGSSQLKSIGYGLLLSGIALLDITPGMFFFLKYIALRKEKSA